jgi:large subunit ribosomal protein L21
MYVIVKTGGKQYRAVKDGTLSVEKLEGEPGATVELEQVLLVRTDDGVKIGTPYVTGAKVIGKIVRQEKGPKIRGFTYKPKKNERRRYGHRQDHTLIQVTEILEG